MNKLFASALIASTALMASPVMAAKQINTPITIGPAGSAIQTGTFENTVTTADLVNGLFTDTYTFVVPTPGRVGASAVTLTFDGSLTFTSVLLNNVALQITALRDSQNNIVSYAATSPFGGLLSGANPQRLSVAGNLTGAVGTYTGNVRFENAVPEPATWALMILGFGVVGYAMRRRPSVRFAQAI